MKFRRPRAFSNNQQGFSLIEILGALAVASLIMLVVSMANAQVLSQTANNNNYTTASRQTLNAIHWISRDVQMAQTIGGTDGFPQTENLMLSWKTWDNSIHSANYSVVNGELIRSYGIDTGTPTINVVAENINIDEAMTYCSSDNNVIRLTITSSVGEGFQTVDVTKKHEITSRPNL
jgi:prepilin-type N-terminal cleavage/methylation domain-containing protein